MSNEKIMQMLKESLNLELWVVTVYEDYLNRIDNPKIREGIVTLIDESVIHAAKMRIAIHKLKLDMPVKNKISKKKIKNLLKTGMKEEIAAQKNYSQIAKKVSNKEIKKIAKQIFKDEVRHEKIVKQLIKLVDK